MTKVETIKINNITEIKPVEYNKPHIFVLPKTHSKSSNASPEENITPEKIYDNIEVNTDRWIRMACNAALTSIKNNNGPFGAVLLQVDSTTGKIIRYWETHSYVWQWNDPTAHAEVTAVRTASHGLGVIDLGEIHKENSKLPQPGELSHCVLFSSAEPCSMCYSAIRWANIPALIFAATRFDSAKYGFSDERILESFRKMYKNRKIKVYQASCSNSLNAFELFEKVDNNNKEKGC